MKDEEIEKILTDNGFKHSNIEISFLPRRKGLDSTVELLKLNAVVEKQLKSKFERLNRKIKEQQKKIVESSESEEKGRSDLKRRK